MKKEELIKIINEEKERYEWGGDEDIDGALNHGDVDWNRIKRAINKFVKNSVGEKDK